MKYSAEQIVSIETAIKIKIAVTYLLKTYYN